MKKLKVTVMMITMVAAIVLGACGDIEYDLNKRPLKNDKEITYEFPQGETFSNPMDIDGQWGKNNWTGQNDYGTGDPFVMRYDGKYYLYPSTSDGNKGVKVFESSNLIDWQYKGFAVSQDEQTSKTAYAPEVIYYHGYFYMCQSSGGSGHYLYKSESPIGPFVGISGNIGRGIDGAFYLSDEGVLYFLHTSTPSGLKYAKIVDIENAEDSGKLTSSVFIEQANLNHWIEGAGVIRREDFSYLTYTGNHIGSDGYRVAYSYAENLDGLNNFIQPKNNITLISTLDNYKGLGHSSNVIGADLDSIYTAYHNLHASGPSRKYNLTRYFSNGKDLVAGGLALKETLKPKLADFYTYGDLTLQNDVAAKLTPSATEKAFTAELNFKFLGDSAIVYLGYQNSNNTFLVEAVKSTNSLKLYQISNGVKSLKAEGLLGTTENPSALYGIRIESGADKAYIYSNGMRKLVYDGSIGAGKIGYGVVGEISYTGYSNDVFGTSDFEAIKSVPSSFPATAYLKSENRGFSIKNAKLQSSGIRQGEKENTKRIGDSTAVVLNTREDYIKYAVNATVSSEYLITATLSAKSKGAVVEIIVDSEKIYSYTIDGAFGDELTTVRLGSVYLEEGNHTVKVRLYNGTIEATSFAFYQNAEQEQEFNNSLATENPLTVKTGSFIHSGGGLTSSADSINLALLGNNGNCDYEISVSVAITGVGNEGGIVFRSKNYSYHPHQVAQSFQGYYLSIKEKLLTVYRYDYGMETLGMTAAIDLDYNGLFEQNVFNQIKIVLYNNTIKIFLNEKMMFDISDNSAQFDGQFGLYTVNTQLTFKDLSYKNI